MIVADRTRASHEARWLALAGGAEGRLKVGFPKWLRPFLQKGVIAITLGRTVYLSENLLGRGEDDVMKIVRHELAHVQQVLKLGLIRFLFRYAKEYLTNRRRGMASFAAYEAISFEVEARRAEEPPPPEPM